MDHAASGELARDVGRRLLLRGVADSKGGMTWKSTYENRFVLPNFSHGPAGIGYSLAALHEYNKAPESGDVILGAAIHLGFSGHSLFTRVFHRTLGMTPAEFRTGSRPARATCRARVMADRR